MPSGAERWRVVPRRAKHLQRPQPEIEGRVRDRGAADASERPARGSRVCCRSRVFLHPRATIATRRRPRFRAGRKSRRKDFGGAPYTATPNEAHLPAEEAEAGQDPRIPGTDEHPRGPRDPQAPPPQRPEAPHGLVAAQRRRRLSRSGEFDRVYRDGSSNATRYLVLYSFPRQRRGASASQARRLGEPQGRRRGRPQPGQAGPARGVLEPRRAAARAPRLRPRRPPGARRADRARGHRRAWRASIEEALAGSSTGGRST